MYVCMYVFWFVCSRWNVATFVRFSIDSCVFKLAKIRPLLSAAVAFILRCWHCWQMKIAQDVRPTKDLLHIWVAYCEPIWCWHVWRWFFYRIYVSIPRWTHHTSRVKVYSSKRHKNIRWYDKNMQNEEILYEIDVLIPRQTHHTWRYGYLGLRNFELIAGMTGKYTTMKFCMECMFQYHDQLTTLRRKW